jgi:subtilase family serine protease
VLAVSAGLLFSPTQLFAASQFTINLSPTLAKSVLVSDANATQKITVVLTLPLSDSRGAADFVRHVSTPTDPLFRKYITTQEFAARYGANATDFAALKEWATSNGLQILHEGYARTMLAVRGTVSQFETLFKTRINNYRSPDGHLFYSAGVRPTIPPAISAEINGVIGLTSSRHTAAHPMVDKAFGENADSVASTNDSIGGSGPGGAYSAANLRNIYGVPDIGRLTPQTVAVFEQGGFTATDVTTYLLCLKLPKATVTQIGVDNYTPGTISTEAIELEAVLDVDLIIAINPDVKEVLVYEDGNSGDPLDVALELTFDQVASDAKAQTLLVSYFQDEVQAGDTAIAAENQALEGLASSGITVVASSGDYGAYGFTGLGDPGSLNVEDPASQPLVTAIGGTTLSTVHHQLYDGEVVWNSLAGGTSGGASGGGVSSYWPIPTWQTSINPAGNGGSSTYRNVPDVAAVADPNSGVAVYSKVNGGWLVLGGTAVSASIWTGYISLLNSAAAWLGIGNLGFFNPTMYNAPTDNWLYGIPSGSNGNAALYGIPGYNANYGYNNCTGGGSLFADDFAYGVLVAGASGTPPGPVNGLTVTKVTTHSAELVWDAAAGATGYVVQLFYQLYPETELYAYKAPFYVTKAAKLELDGLTRYVVYYPYVGAVNSGGASQAYISQGFEVLAR